MQDLLLSTGDLAVVIGVPLKTVETWLEDGLLTPAFPGRIGGYHHRYSLPQALGVAVGRAMRTGGRGCSRSYLKKIFGAFNNTTLPELEAAFSRGDHFLAGISHHKPILRGEQYDWVDVYTLYQKMQGRIEKMLAKREAPRPGRLTGLQEFARSRNR